jgi:hypothetical protein
MCFVNREPEFCNATPFTQCFVCLFASVIKLTSYVVFSCLCIICKTTYYSSINLFTFHSFLPRWCCGSIRLKSSSFYRMSVTNFKCYYCLILTVSLNTSYLYSWIRKSNALFLIIVCSTKSSRLTRLIIRYVKYCPKILWFTTSTRSR